MNSVTLMGRLVKDPDLRYSGEGKAFLKFGLAIQREFDKEKADFINCVAFNKTAENIGKFFQKGNRILIQGRIQTGSYENKNGNTVYTTDIIVDKFNFIESSSQSNSNNNYRNNNNDYIEDDEDSDEFPFN